MRADFDIVCARIFIFTLCVLVLYRRSATVSLLFRSNFPIRIADRTHTASSKVLAHIVCRWNRTENVRAEKKERRTEDKALSNWWSWKRWRELEIHFIFKLDGWQKENLETLYRMQKMYRCICFKFNQYNHSLAARKRRKKKSSYWIVFVVKFTTVSFHHSEHRNFSILKEISLYVFTQTCELLWRIKSERYEPIHSMRPKRLKTY